MRRRQHEKMCKNQLWQLAVIDLHDDKYGAETSASTPRVGHSGE